VYLLTSTPWREQELHHLDVTELRREYQRRGRRLLCWRLMREDRHAELERATREQSGPYSDKNREALISRWMAKTGRTLAACHWL
jgi:hypothetical protein